MNQSGGRASFDLPETGDYMELIGQLKTSLVHPKDRAVYERNLDKKHIADYLKDHDHQELGYGHAVLRRLFRSSDVIGRMGGDEFAVFFCGRFTPEQIAGRAQKVCDEVKGIMDSPGDLPGSSCSIGISVSEDCRKSFRRLYKEADGALYNQKKHGRDGYCFFESP